MSEHETSDIKKQLDRIERGLFGDKQIGHVGVIAVQQNHERRLSKIERTSIYIAGAGGVLGVLWTLWSQWPHK